MTNLTPRAKKLARRLRSEYRQIRSWRKLTETYDNPLIKPRTIHRIATSLKLEGEQWCPKDTQILTALGLITPRKPRIKRTLSDLSREELIALGDRLNTRLGEVARELKRRTA